MQIYLQPLSTRECPVANGAIELSGLLVEFPWVFLHEKLFEELFDRISTHTKVDQIYQ